MKLDPAVDVVFRHPPLAGEGVKRFQPITREAMAAARRPRRQTKLPTRRFSQALKISISWSRVRSNAQNWTFSGRLWYFVLGIYRDKDGQDCEKYITWVPHEHQVQARVSRSPSVKHRLGSMSGHKGTIWLNNTSLHSCHVTSVLGASLGVEFNGDTYFTIWTTVWPNMMKTKSTCIIMVSVSR